MASTFIGALVSTQSSGSTINIDIPAGSAAGDLAVYTVMRDPTGGSVSDNGGADQTLFAFQDVADMAGGMWCKTLTSTDISNGWIQVSISTSASGWGGTCSAWRNAGGVTFVGVQNGSSTTAALTNPSGSGDYFASAWLDDDLTSVSSYPTSYTQGRDSDNIGTSSNGGTIACAVATGVDPGEESFVFGSSDAWFTLVAKIIGYSPPGEILRPDSTVYTNNVTGDYTTLDEETPSDSDYIQTNGLSVGGTAQYIGGFTNPTSSVPSGTATCRFRARTSSTSFGNVVAFELALVNSDGTTIYARSGGIELTTSFTLYEFSFDQADVLNWNTVNFSAYFRRDAGSFTSPTAYISWVEVQLPGQNTISNYMFMF